MGGSTYYCEAVSEWQEYTGEDLKYYSSKLEHNYLSTSVSNNDVIIAKGDSGASSHYLTIDDAKKCLGNVKPYNGPPVTLPDSGEISPTHEGQLPLSEKLSNQAKRATALPALKSSSLVSLGQLCDDDCTVILDKNKLLALKNSEIVLRGSRNYLNGLWDIPIQKSKLQSDNYNSPSIHSFNYEMSKSAKEQRNYNIQTKQTKKDNSYFRLFDGLNQLINVNECDYLCNNQQK